MVRLSTRWLAAVLVLALAALFGAAFFTQGNTWSVMGTRTTEADDPDRAAPVDPDEEEAEEHESDAIADPNAKGSGPQASRIAGHTAFIDTRNLKAKPIKRESPRAEAELRDNGVHTGAAGTVQAEQVALAAPSPSINVVGLDFNNWGAGHPPDTNGVIGPNHFVQSVNTSVGIFSKSTGARLSAFTFDAFFANSGTAECDSNNGGDPTVTYDVPSGKWIIADFAWININSGPFFECVAVSSGSDPVASTWTFYSIPAGDGRFPDYPKFGSGPDAVFFTINNFQGNSYTGAGVYALRRSTLGTPSLQVQHITTSSSFFSLLPANLVDAAPPAGPEYVTSIWSGRLRVWRFSVNWTTPSSTTFTSIANIAVSYTSQGSIPTPGESVDSLSPRAMNKAQQRNGSLWLTQTVRSGTRAGIRWYEVVNLTGTPSIRQQSTFIPNDGLYRWMPSLAVDKRGNMAVGYNAGSRTVNPSIRYAGRLATDPLNTLGQSETSLIAGTGAPSSGNFNRWGDYSEMSVDPVDGCTFWFTGEYYATTGANWQTRVGSFKFPSCT
jgi:hypothetical protein